MVWLTEEYLKATMHMKEEEIRRARLVSEARKQTQQQRNDRTWRWRVEPGMEEAFRDLLGWMLPSQRDTEMETANSPPYQISLAESEGRQASERESLAA